MENQGLKHFIEQKGVIYSNLVYVFYFNLKIHDVMARKKVKGVTIILDDYIWANVAMLPIREDVVKVHLGVEGFNRLLVFQSFLRNPQLQTGCKQLQGVKNFLSQGSMNTKG